MLNREIAKLNVPPIFLRLRQEYIIEREGEYPTPVYHSVVSLDRGHDLYNDIHTYHSRPCGGF